MGAGAARQGELRLRLRLAPWASAELCVVVVVAPSEVGGLALALARGTNLWPCARTIAQRSFQAQALALCPPLTHRRDTTPLLPSRPSTLTRPPCPLDIRAHRLPAARSAARSARPSPPGTAGSPSKRYVGRSQSIVRFRKTLNARHAHHAHARCLLTPQRHLHRHHCCTPPREPPLRPSIHSSRPPPSCRPYSSIAPRA